jgi:hypothetical protein
LVPTFFFGGYTYRMDKWLTVPPDLEPFIGSAITFYSLYRPKKKTLLGTIFWRVGFKYSSILVSYSLLCGLVNPSLQTCISLIFHTKWIESTKT